MPGQVTAAPSFAIIGHTHPAGLRWLHRDADGSGVFLPIFGELADPGSSPGWCGAEEAGCMNVHGAEIDWDQLGRFPYDRTHAEL